MSDPNTTTVQPVNTAAVANAVTNSTNAAATALAASFAKRDKVIFTEGDGDEEKQAFLTFATSFPEGTMNDWAENAPDTFTTLGVVHTENKGNRTVACPSMVTAFADPVVQRNLYRQFVNRWFNQAMDDDADPATFVVVNGIYKTTYDMEGFNDRAKAMIHFLKEQGLIGITKTTLRYALQSSAAAAATFSRLKPEAWVGILNVMRSQASAKNLDVSIYDHWLATRDVKLDEGGEITLDLGNLGAAVTKSEAELEAEREAKKAPAAPAQAATA